ncbi:MAG: transglutaminase-like domain-containing protein, partial [Planctomycetota bacterium]
MFRVRHWLVLSLFGLSNPAVLLAEPVPSEGLSVSVKAALERAGENRKQLESALERVRIEEREGLLFLIEHMPEPDLKSLSADYLIENVEYSYRAWRESPWKKQVSKELFLNNILPYANVSERRDRWRKDFYEKCMPLVKGAKTPGRAAVLLNQKLFPLVKVKYSTKRRRADQGPLESIEIGLASCTGLSILLIDACRAVGVPARFVGVPLWADRSGNHSWVEVWDERKWHFTGAAEPAGDLLDKAWFTGRASKAQRDQRRHAIYAVSYKKTPLQFPMVWDRGFRGGIRGVNVTDRYAGKATELPAGTVRVLFRALDGGNRCSAHVAVKDAKGNLVFEGKTKDEGFDANDHTVAPLKLDGSYKIEIESDGRKVTKPLKVAKEGQLVTVKFPEA